VAHDLWQAAGATASSPDATAIGRANRSRDTKAEVALRSCLHRRGLRFRKRKTIFLTPTPGSPRRWTQPDVVFPTERVVVFVDGCFWHRCPEHFHAPKTNAAYWEPKIARNVARDRDTTAQLEARGWVVLRVWEHEDADEAAERVERLVRQRRASRSASR
jgi:DNA mismatch endonuclease, patch repair protein